MNKSILQTRI